MDGLNATRDGELRFSGLPLSGSNSVARVTAFQAVGRGFESRLPLFKTKLEKLSWGKRNMRESSRT